MDSNAVVKNTKKKSAPKKRDKKPEPMTETDFENALKLASRKVPANAVKENQNDAEKAAKQLPE